MDKQIVYVHTKEYYMAMKKSKLLLITICVNLTNTVLSKRSQAQKSTYCNSFIYKKKTTGITNLWIYNQHNIYCRGELGG